MLSKRRSITKRYNDVLSVLSKKTKLTRILHKPRAIMVEPTNHCNLSCPLCPTGSNTIGTPRGYMDYNKYKSLVDELGTYLEEMNIWGFGEPMLHESIYDMVTYASERGVFTKISTNGQFFEKWEDAERIVMSGLDSMIVSLDGASHETLNIYRKNASFDKIVSGIKKINKTKQKYRVKSPVLILQFIVMKHNEHEIDKITAMADELKMRLRLKPVSLSREPNEWRCYLPDKKQFSRYEYDSDKSITGPSIKQPGICPFPWDWAHVNWDGSVVPCCKDPHRFYQLGNAFDDGGFLKVWNSKAYIEFRKMFLSDKKQLRLCRNCVLPGDV